MSCRSTEVEVALVSALDDRALSRVLATAHVLKGELSLLPDDRQQVRLELFRAGDGRSVWRPDEALALADLQTLPTRVSREVTAQRNLVRLVEPGALSPVRGLLHGLMQTRLVRR